MMYLKLWIIVFLAAYGVNLCALAHRGDNTEALGKLVLGAVFLAGAWRLALHWLM